MKLLRPKLRTANLSKVRFPKKTAEPFYQSPEYLAWRRAVLARDGNTCQGAGPHAGRLIADHVVERRDGGPDLDPTNGITLCHACHNRKTARAKAERLGA